MSTLSELSSKADYIASRNNQLRTQWRTYENSLTQAITQSKNNINHEVRCGESQGISFTLFSHFAINIHLCDDFYSHDIVYSLNLSPSSDQPDFKAFAHAHLTEEGLVDGSVDIRDKNAVFEHYLNKIFVIYQCLFDSLRDNKSVYRQLKQLIGHTKNSD
ncbi:formate hydrogenlyase regulator HycA [Yersinia ruckeri]|uniref:formate hydrogenlyase n=1 Tax=Yersinia ruckeri TaxID=29486 RepID=UPI0004E437DA|nr:formate hydrogenlyase [Yersinia ruckeri]AKA37048.1 formate hydrogenlyase [Yersinia ruckeri]ARZ01239.1 Formate hydrogenlyase regulatory protein HycA [Yersinia ruckeri]EKN3360392.1 formate hydrogenlyase regulator HycA [Yersinia ruckeri]EKN4181565.1 formate hydrogenlyase regulator HycA [Yersinia ruckeri]EKN4197084.1 formate hydrogenlyase regulator HycA [Yersinia ruckeri]